MSIGILILILQLGSDDFRERELAMRALQSAGPLAGPHLIVAARSADTEIARRAELILRSKSREAASRAKWWRHPEFFWLWVNERGQFRHSFRRWDQESKTWVQSDNPDDEP
jgi:hypothetical protein